jgi:Ca2+-binding EF-hand superfamily protein
MQGEAMNTQHGMLALLLVLAGCTDTNQPSAEVPSFADLDTDGDHVLSQREAAAVPELANVFAVADADLDGRLSVAEFSQATIEGTTVSPENASGPLFSVVDRDGDGAITLAEADTVPEVRDNFASFDTDKNGQLNSQEYRNVVEEVEEEVEEEISRQ